MMRSEEPTQSQIVRAALLLALLLSLATPIAALAQGHAQVYLSPPGDAPITGQPVTVDILAQDVSNLYGLEIHLRFDPTTLRLEDADPDQDGVQLTPGSLLDPTQGFIVANQADNQAGTAVFAITLINPAPPVEGSGVVAQATLVPLQPGPLRLDLENAKLVTHDLQTLDVALSGLEVPVGGQALAPASPTGQTDGAIAGTSPGLGMSIWVLVLVALAVVSIPLVGAWFILAREAKGQS
jgi:hypothetical protein